MNTLEAINIIEGLEEAFDDDVIVEAWQHLVDTGIAWKLQGSYGRQATALIEAGIIKFKYLGDVA
jgi:hypothetical protein